VGRHHQRTTTFAGPLGAGASRQASAASARAVVFQAIMAVDRERERSRVPMNDCRWTAEVIRRVGVSVVFRIETLLTRLVRVSCTTGRKSSTCTTRQEDEEKTYMVVGLLARDESCQSGHSARHPTFLGYPQGPEEKVQPAHVRG
jgi:hypothetical protein